MAEELYTVRQVANLTGYTEKQIRGRIERGTLRSIVRERRRLIPRSALDEAGLLRAVTPTERELLDRLERQAEEIGQLRERLDD